MSMGKAGARRGGSVRKLTAGIALAAAGLALAGSVVTAVAQSTPALDPYASSNGNFPDRTVYSGPLRVGNLDYDFQLLNAQTPFSGGQPITTANAARYLTALKAHLGISLAALVNNGASWNPKKAGWYDMIWLGEGTRLPDGTIDPNSGRDPIGNTYTGQIVPPQTFINRHDPSKQAPLPTVSVQNHAVIYYNGIAARMLAKVWADPYRPDVSAINFPDGSITVKIEAATPDATQWKAVTGASTWQVFRPTVADQLHPPAGGAKAKLLNVHPIQMSIAVKDRTASPTTGWVYAAFVYDASSTGTTPWDRFVPVGAQWGNDPQLAPTPRGNNGSPNNLRETWFNPNAPFFAHGTRGWGGRLAGPMDVANRANVLFTGGGNSFVNLLDTGASSCLSCHSAAEFPWTRNLYPSPNRAFPRDGQPFVLFVPGSPEWNRRFQNPSVPYGISGKTTPRGLDYDFALMFALGVESGAVGNQGVAFSRFSVH